MTAAEARTAPSADTSRLGVWLLLAAYIAIIVLTALHHEFWRDEVRAFSLATEGSLRDMFTELRTEGHPALWYLLLRGGYWLTGSRLVLPVLSLVIATCAMYVILRYSPFTMLQKVLIVFGVYPVFEYSVIARNYGLGVLVLSVIGLTYPTRRDRPVRFGLLLAVLANTSAHAAITAAALLFGWGVEYSLDRRRDRTPAPADRRRTGLGVAIALAGMLAAAATVSGGKPVPRATLDANPGVTLDTSHAAGSIARGGGLRHQVVTSLLRPDRWLVGLLPSPTARLGDDNSQLAYSRLRFLEVDVLLLAMIVGWWGRWSLLATGVSATLGTSLMFGVVYAGSTRHIGVLWFLFLVLYWQVIRDPAPEPGGRRRTFWALTVPLTVAMVLQAIEGVRRVRQDWTSSLTSAPAVAALLRQPGYENATVLATYDYVLESLPYYGVKRLYFHNQRRFESHVHYRLPFDTDYSLKTALANAEGVAASGKAPVIILVRNREYGEAAPAERALLHDRAIEIADLSTAVSDEAYRVYRLLPRENLAPGGPR